MKISRKILLASLLGALLVIAGGGWFGAGKFRQWQERRLGVSATAFFQQGDFRSASLSARQALQMNPRNAAACAVMAQLADAGRSPEAILWWQKLADAKPGDLQVLLNLAESAIRFDELFIAEQALAQVKEGDRKTQAYHQTAGAFELAQKRYSAASAHFEAALQLDPQNESLQLSLATLRLGTGKPADAALAREELTALAQKPAFQRAAIRALLMDARAQGNALMRLELAGKLRQAPDAALDDRLLYLEELQQAKSPLFDDEFQAIQKGTAKNADTLYAVMTWMNAHGLAAQTLKWFDLLPPGIRSQLPVPLAMAEACTALQDWKRLGEITSSGEWTGLDFLRLAIQVRCMEEANGQVRSSEFARKWERAIIATHGNTNALSMLARLVTGWGWREEAAQIWWIIANKPVGQRAALKILYRMAVEKKNTPELYRVARRIYQLEPSNPVAGNNAAMLALLLGKEMDEAHRLAEKNHLQIPNQPGISSTYALSLHLQGRTKEGIAVLAKLPDPQKTFWDVSVAACYGLLLSADNQPEKAKPFLDMAAAGKKNLLPEEIALLERALGRAL